MKTGSCIAMTILSVVGLAHLARVIFNVSLVIGSFNVPNWMSILAFLLTGLIAYLLWKERKS